MTAPRLMLSAACLALAATLLLCAAGCPPGQKQEPPFAAKSDQDDFEQAADRPPNPKTLFALGKLLSSQGRDAEAVVVLSRVINREPRLLAAYHELAEIHLRRGRVAEAAAVLSVGLSVAPRDPALQNNLGMCRLFQENYRGALSCFTTATAAAPGDARYRANLALTLGMLGRYEECLAVYEQLLRPAQAHYNLAVICDSRGERARASEEYEKAFAIDPALKSKLASKSGLRPVGPK